MNVNPQVEIDGTKRWWVAGYLHREDGPAVEWADGSKYWYIWGKQLTYNEWRAICKPLPIVAINTSKNKSKPIVVIL